MSALNKQEGGNHYKSLQIQPIEFTMKNNLDFIQGNIIKYTARHKFKDGAQDLKKVIHYAELGLELIYGIKPEPKPEPNGTTPVNVTPQTLALMLWNCLNKFGEDEVDDALSPIIKEWEAQQEKEKQTEPESISEIKAVHDQNFDPPDPVQDTKTEESAREKCPVPGCYQPRLDRLSYCSLHHEGLLPTGKAKGAKP